MQTEKFGCKLCRDIQRHIVSYHKQASFFRCKVTNKFTGIRCDFECHVSLGCFTNHAKRVHGEFYNGISTAMEDEDSFSLEIIELNEREFEHSRICDLDRDLGKSRKKSEIKHRGELEDKIQQNFINGTKAADVFVARDFYKAGLSGVKNLIDKFPRRYKRKVAISSVGKKKLFHYIDLSEKLNVDFFE